MPKRKKSSQSMYGYEKPFTAATVPYVPQFRRENPVYSDDHTQDRYGVSWSAAAPMQKLNRYRDGYRGMGAYYGGRGAYRGVNRFKKATKWANFAQGLVKSGQSMLAGSGEYSYNSTFPGTAQGGAGIPEFTSVEDEMGAVMVSFKEYLTDIYGNMVDDNTTNNFTEVQYSINPGLERSFPFLSQFAANFDEYEMKQLVYTYKSTINTDSSTTNGQVGSVIMATNYIVDSLPFTDKNAMLQYHGSSSARVTAVSVHGVECDPTKSSGTPGKYIRTAPVLTGKDATLYDVGVFNLAISGTPAAFSNQPIGELWVEYTCLLRKPKVLTGYGQAISKDIFAHKSNVGITNWWPASAINQLVGQQNSIGCTVEWKTDYIGTRDGLLITFPTWYTSPTEIKLYLTGSSMLNIGYEAADQNDDLSLNVTGNMVPQKDMLMYSLQQANIVASAVAWSFSLVTTDVTGESLNVPTFNLIIHVRPGTLYGGTQGTSAVNNTLFIQLDYSAAAGLTTPAIKKGFLSIEEYTQMSNPGLLPVLLDSSGVPAALS